MTRAPIRELSTDDLAALRVAVASCIPVRDALLGKDLAGFDDHTLLEALALAFAASMLVDGQRAVLPARRELVATLRTYSIQAGRAIRLALIEQHGWTDAEAHREADIRSLPIIACWPHEPAGLHLGLERPQRIQPSQPSDRGWRAVTHPQSLRWPDAPPVSVVRGHDRHDRQISLIADPDWAPRMQTWIERGKQPPQPYPAYARMVWGWPAPFGPEAHWASLLAVIFEQGTYGRSLSVPPRRALQILDVVTWAEVKDVGRVIEVEASRGEIFDVSGADGVTGVALPLYDPALDAVIVRTSGRAGPDIPADDTEMRVLPWVADDLLRGHVA